MTTPQEEFSAWTSEFGEEQAAVWFADRYGRPATLHERAAAQAAAESAHLSQMRRANPFEAAAAAKASPGAKYAPADPSKGDRDVTGELRRAQRLSK
jgi:hypothetical protein